LPVLAITLPAEDRVTVLPGMTLVEMIDRSVVIPSTFAEKPRRVLSDGARSALLNTAAADLDIWLVSVSVVLN